MNKLVGVLIVAAAALGLAVSGCSKTDGDKTGQGDNRQAPQGKVITTPFGPLTDNRQAPPVTEKPSGDTANRVVSTPFGPLTGNRQAPPVTEKPAGDTANRVISTPFGPLTDKRQAPPASD